MLQLFGSGLISLWLEMAGVPTKPVDVLDVFTSNSRPGLVLAPDPSPLAANTVQQYLQQLEAAGLTKNHQGIWLQSGFVLLAENQGTMPLPAASITKVATSLAALKTWGANHQFETLVGATGPIRNGVLQGDLIVHGGGDPFFVWEEAIALGNSLNRMGIKRITGNLVIAGNFAMNYKTNPLIAGQLLQQAMNATTWSNAARVQYQAMPPKTPARK